MNLKHIYALILSCQSISYPATLHERFPIDFYGSMSDNNKHFDITYAKTDQTWLTVKNLFEKTMNTEYSLKQTPRIPKIFHLIWLGSNVPQRFLDIKKRLEELHPGFLVKLWTDTEATAYPMKNRDAFNKTPNYGEKSDIWRYEILYNEGGVYLDGDFTLLQPLTDLFYASDFFIGMVQWKDFSLANGFLGAAPHHPILGVAMNNITPFNGDRSADSVMLRTGPWYITRCFAQASHEQNLNNIALPPSFFFPWPHYVPFENNMDKIKSLIKAYSLAVHQYAGSWQWWSKNFGR
jgi:mannosyltransferase OCH1-like enzyme